MSSSTPQRMVEREELHHRAEPDLAGRLGGRREKDLLIGGETQIGAVMLGDVVAGEAGGVEHLHELDPVAKQLMHRRAGMPSMWSKSPNSTIRPPARREVSSRSSAPTLARR